LHPELREPVCQASILRYNFAAGDKPGRILFANPASKRRESMTVRVSYDDGQSWPAKKLIYAGSAAYSSMTKLADGSIGILFERDGYESISFARFTIDWLERE
jgi:sialidase-1